MYEDYEGENGMYDEDYETELYLKARKAAAKRQCEIMKDIEAED